MQNSQQNKTPGRREDGFELAIPKKMAARILIIMLIIGAGVYGASRLRGGESAQQLATAERAPAAAPVSQASSRVPLGFFRPAGESEIVKFDGKPYLLFIGAKFCPFCAAERWALVDALGRFGTWNGLASDPEVAEGVGLPTYDLMKASYASQYLSFSHKEIATVGGASLERPSEFDRQWIDKHNPRGGVPFIFLGGKWQQHSSGYSPELLYDLAFERVRADMESGANTPYVSAIRREADIVTAYLCTLTDNQPEEVCHSDKIHDLVAQIEGSL